MVPKATLEVSPTTTSSSNRYAGLSNPTDRRVLEILTDEGPMTRNQLVTKTSIARSTLYDSLSRLILKGHVSKSSDKSQSRGRPKVFFKPV